MPRKRQAFVTTLRVLGFACALLLLWTTFHHASWGHVRHLLANVGPAFLLVLAPQGLALAMESLGWRRAFQSLEQGVPFWPLLRVRIATEALAQSLPAGMVWCESVKPYLLQRDCGIPVARGIAGMAARKYLLLISQAACLAFAASVAWAPLDAASTSLIGARGLPWCALGGALVLGAGAWGMSLGLRHGEVAAQVLSTLKRFPLERWRRALERRATEFFRTDHELARFFRASGAERLAAATFFLGVWLLEATETFVILRVLDVNVSWSAALGMEVLVVLIRHVLFMMPAGLGAQDLGYVAFLGALGIPEAVSVGAAFSVLKRSKEGIWSLVGWALLLFDPSQRRDRGGAIHAAPIRLEAR